jgi:hypothetical protein
MSEVAVQTVTHRDGRRFYRIYEATPPRAMWSLTTLLGQASKEAMIWKAGQIGVEAALAEASEYARTIREATSEPARLLALNDFAFQVECRMAERYGRTKRGDLNPPHLSRWKARADVGSAAHWLIEEALKHALGLDKPVPFDWSSLTDAEAVEANRAFVKWDVWRNMTGFTPLASESVVWVDGLLNRPGGQQGDGWHDYACRIDLACEVGGVRAILDVKTGKMDKKPVLDDLGRPRKNGRSYVWEDCPYPTQWLQVEAQRRAANARKLCGGGFDVAGVLWVPAAGGEVQLFLNDRRDRDADFQAFDHLAGYATWLLGPPGRE